MLDQPLTQPELQKPKLEKGEPLFTKDPYGNIVSCEYQNAAGEHHTVILTEGISKGGTCYKSADELFTEKPQEIMYPQNESEKQNNVPTK